MVPINRNPGVREVTSFTRVWLPLFITALGAVVWWRAGQPAAAVAVWAAGGALVAAALASPRAARLLFVGLVTVTYPIGLVISLVVLAVMFYGVFTPVGWVMRLAGRDPLRLRARATASHWLPYEQDDSAERAFRQY